MFPSKAAWARTLGRESDRVAFATAVIIRGIAEHGAVSPEYLGAQRG